MRKIADLKGTTQKLDTQQMLESLLEHCVDDISAGQEQVTMEKLISLTKKTSK